MTTKRNTRTFQDLNLLFSVSPSSKDVTKKVDEEAIKTSLKNLIQTKNFERPFHPEIGCQVYSLLFENFTPVVVETAKKTIFDVVEKFEPRVTVLSVDVQQTQDPNEITITIYFKINNSEKPITIKTTLQRVR